ncbi:MAG: hypothetical protein C4520_18885 [Candidatus Abyssobacteria bacterium SURF_5]|uniref:Uncharacterized protein n=1 Tax=Abyssobacteria bacterium (strain SURF_5) TaxID=2093360 RepID=A0A3A4N9H1_ABYX5|nr:MAG: hypothetical protein C4520_18885 [Candidatus Abyssubacteria bacterium SURF_5]
MDPGRITELSLPIKLYQIAGGIKSPEELVLTFDLFEEAGGTGAGKKGHEPFVSSLVVVSL